MGGKVELLSNRSSISNDDSVEVSSGKFSIKGTVSAIIASSDTIKINFADGSIEDELSPGEYVIVRVPNRSVSFVMDKPD